MRDILTVIAQIKNRVPRTFDNREILFRRFDKITNSVLYTAPEAMYIRWQEVSEALGNYLEAPDTDWKKEIVTIFGGTNEQV